MGRGGHKVHLSYWRHGDIWCYRFIGEGIVPLGPVRRTRNPDVIRGIVERGGGITNSEARCMLDFGLEKQGQGGLYLKLTDEQYQKLKA